MLDEQMALNVRPASAAIGRLAAPPTTAQLFSLSLLILLLQLFLRPVPELPAGSAAKSTRPLDTSVEGRQRRACKVVLRFDFAEFFSLIN